MTSLRLRFQIHEPTGNIVIQTTNQHPNIRTTRLLSSLNTWSFLQGTNENTATKLCQWETSSKLGCVPAWLWTNATTPWFNQTPMTLRTMPLINKYYTPFWCPCVLLYIIIVHFKKCIEFKFFLLNPLHNSNIVGISGNSSWNKAQ